MLLRKLSRTFKITAAFVVAAFSTGLLPASAAYATNTKYFVCKYVGTPGVNETLQTGGNPISVSQNAVSGGVGSYFADAQGQSYVLAIDNTPPGPEGDPSASACPAPRGPVTITPPTIPTIDPCGPNNATFNYAAIPTGNYTYVINQNGSITFTANTGYKFAGGPTVTVPAPADSNVACNVQVTPQAPSVSPVCGPNNDNLILPSQTGISFTPGSWVSGQRTVTASALPGYVIPDAATKSWTFTDYNTACPPTQVQASPATVHSDVCGTSDDKYTIPTTTGVTYLVNNVVKSAGNHSTNGATSVTVVAQPASAAYVLTGQTSWTLTFSNDRCVTPPAPTKHDVCETDGDTYTIPFKFGVKYYVGGVQKLPGTYSTNDALEVNVTAQPASGYTFDGATSSWKLTFTDEACAKTSICHINGNGTYVKITNISVSGVYHGHYGFSHHFGLDIIPPFVYDGKTYSQNWNILGQSIYNNDCKKTVTPGEPEFFDICGDSFDKIYLPQKKGVVYKVNGDVVTSHFYHPDSSSVTVTAEPDDGYRFPGESQVRSWDYEFTDENCITISKSAEELTDTNKDGVVGVGDTVTWTITVTNNADFFLEYFNVKVVDMDATLEDDGEIYWLAPGASKTLKATSVITADDIREVCKVENTASFEANYSLYDLWNHGDEQENERSLNGGYKKDVFTGSATAEATFTCPVPGRGGDTPGQTLGTATTASAVLPATLPATGGNDSPFMVIVASILAYGAAYFLQGRRRLARQESYEA